MARKDIANGLSYNQGFYNANDNFVEIYNNIDSIQNRGYINSKNIADFNNATENGKYAGYNALNAPTSNSTVGVEVIKEASGVISQIGTVTFGPGAGNTYTRIKQNNAVWTAWKQLVTTEKTEIDIPLASGFVVDTSPTNWKHKIIKNGDDSYDLWFAVKRGDNSNIPTGYIQIGNMVVGHIPNAFYIGSGLAVENDTSFAVGFCYVDSSRLMFHNTFASAKFLKGYIRFRTN